MTEAEPNKVPLWYGLLVLVVALLTLALASGAPDSEGRTAGMRILNLRPRRSGLPDAANPTVPRLRLVLRWWLVGALAFGGSWLVPGAGAPAALLVGWLFVLLPGRRTLWDRATGLLVVEVRLVDAARRSAGVPPTS